MQARILWIEGNRVEGPSFIPSLRKKGYIVEVAATGSEAFSLLSKGDPDLIVLHAASLRSSGKRICRSLSEKSSGTPIIVIASANHPMNDIVGAKTILTLPFTPRKLLNRIAPLISSDSGNLLHVGPIRLDLERKQLHCQGRETKLTPRLVYLLKVFMKHPGEVMEREQLFREVWSTEYTEDTRTLDVHISWLRRALETDPRNPQYLKTVRGVGYRLDIEPTLAVAARTNEGHL